MVEEQAKQETNMKQAASMLVILLNVKANNHLFIAICFRNGSQGVLSRRKCIKIFVMKVVVN
jgi:hypothetical protein